MEEIGGLLLEQIGSAPTVLTPPSLAMLAAIEAGATPESAPSAASRDVPVPLRHIVGNNISTIVWKWLAPGGWHLPIPLSPGIKGNLRLLKVTPGQAMPEHGHGGSEPTLLLSGSYPAELGVLRTGDICDLDEEVEHRPIADPRSGGVS